MFTIEEIISATGGRMVNRGRQVKISDVSTDSRDIHAGDLFVPLAGKRFDGHLFIEKALEKGASAILASEGYIDKLDKETFKDKAVILVDNTLKGLQGLAKMHRNRFNIPVIAISGSNGKTTTKEMAYSILKNDLAALRSEGNINNYIGVPLTIFKLQTHHQALIVEMGISLKGEMSELCQIAHPTIGLITNIGPTHLETLGSIEGVARAKWELAEFIEAEGGALILNADDPYLAGLTPDSKCNILTYGIKTDARIRALQAGTKWEKGEFFTIKRDGKEIDIQLKLFGMHNIYNALAAAAVASSLDIGLDDIKKGLEGFTPVPLRSEIIRLNKGTLIINDTYNANPASMRCAINTLSALKGKGRAIAVLGDMLELGDSSLDAHLELGRFAASAGIDRLIILGDMAPQVLKGAKDAGMNDDRIRICNDRNEIPQLLIEIAGRDDAILVKGSRGMCLETVVKKLLTIEGM